MMAVDQVEGQCSRDRTPGPTPAMMAMGMLDMVLKWETTERRRVVGCMNRRGNERREVYRGGKPLTNNSR